LREGHLSTHTSNHSPASRGAHTESLTKSIESGWLGLAKKSVSPFYNERPDFNDISLLVIHNISLPPEQFGDDYIEDFFCNNLDVSRHPYFKNIASLKVSSHLLITREGEVIQFVPFHKRAWHAGQSSFEGRQECNDFAIGIELEGADKLPYTDVQYKQLATVTLAITKEYPIITQERIVGHSDIAPDRKTDPGESFNWKKYFTLLEQKQ
jgi:AmpD protein